MSPLFDRESAYYTKHEILSHLPISYQTLMAFQSSAEKKISEQLAYAIDSEPSHSLNESPSFMTKEQLCKQIITVNAFNDASTRFAAERAKSNQRSIYQTAGAISGNVLVTSRIVLEALIYAVFALIVPFSLLPGGMRIIYGWFFLNTWIQLWPPLYGILNYITVLASEKYAASVMGGISSGFSMFTSAGFQDLAYDIAALGGYLSLSVPVIA